MITVTFPGVGIIGVPWYILALALLLLLSGIGAIAWLLRAVRG
ncbi:MAG TPA: hypothetical protein VFB38_10885 [Chthonomonadaceae bacterium]|nr:hypothetical protein [Chthonomonadaceae bacterium]